MKKGVLSSKKYWDGLYVNHDIKKLNSNLNPSYKVLFDILKKYVKPNNKKKVIEIGSAPGMNLYHLNKIFKYKPYGLEYTDNGFYLNKKFFCENKIDGQVIKADFLDKNVISKYEDTFDMVVSFGFIEHFNNPKEIVNNHIKILKKEGILLILIPNLKGINYFFNYFFNKKLFNIHNLNIMEFYNFKELYDDNLLETIYCDYFGKFSFRLFSSSNKFKAKIKTFFYVFFDNIFSRIFSLFSKSSHKPYLVFIGKKK